ncbi:sensor histidine kinase [Jiella sonneratiae]|uniref:histidine kinase n=1 Tax=Jiella sonneratiae TaxID=2816856 RepID=A0ABS3IZD4_9HYPH|nr:GAF domain-containing protein [Jiella sonneratiae]MBO0902791.1 GAF domain-containing protein [Jiella sonneratiae]
MRDCVQTSEFESTIESPLTDPERLGLLRSSQLLDSEAEEVFDRGVQLATRLLGTKVALLSLVDRDRQFFKAQAGLPEPTASLRETPLTHSFCQHVVATRRMLVVEDARAHPLVAENAAIRDLGVIAYIGVPVVTSDGHVLGSFCAIDSVPRSWTVDEIATLQAIAKGVESEIRLRIEVERRRQLQEKADADRARLALVLEKTGDGVMTFGPDLVVGYANRGAHALLGADGPLAGQRLWDVFPVGDDDRFVAMVEAVRMTGAGNEGLVHCGDMGRWLEARLVPGDEATTLFFSDATARQRTLEARHLLVRELHHRIKNLFAIVRGMISMTARSASDPARMAEALQGRLFSLARAHDLIRPVTSGDCEKDYQDIVFSELVRILVEPFRKPGGDRLTIDGEPLRLGVNSITYVALLLHELATNAAKYGALSGEDGRLAIGWSVDAETLRFRWVETGGPELAGAPAEKGFGSRLISLCVETQLEGTLDVAWPPAGMRLEAEIPLRTISR